MNKKIFAGVAFAFAFAFAFTASAVYQSDIYTAQSGYLMVGSGMGAKAYQSANVIAAQKALNACMPGMDLALDGKFGPKTKEKFVSFQASKGIKQDGIIGPVTAGQLAACSEGTNSSTGTGSSTGSVSLDGTDGSINDVSKISSYNNEEVGEGESDVKVAGFEVEATNDGDILLKSIKVSFDSTGNSGSDNLDDYIDSVKVWMGSKEIGSADVDDFSENGSVYSRTITLNSSAVVKSDDTEKFYISVDAVNNLDSGDISGDSWTVDVENIRFQDGSGVVTTDDSTGDIDNMNVAMNFVDFGTAADTELKISTDSNSPEADVITVDEQDGKDGIVLLKGKLKLEGTSDVVIDEFPVSFSPTGSNMNVIASSISLIIDGEEYTESVPSIAAAATGTVVFDNLDFDLSAGDTVSFSVVADINGTDDYNEGDTLEANVTSTNRDYIDAENEEGDQLSDSTEKSGTANGEAQEFRSTGISVSFVSAEEATTAGNSSNDDTGTFTLKFKVTANGEAVYIDPTFAATTVAGTSAIGSTVQVQRSGTATVGGTSLVLENLTDNDTEGSGNYKVEEGQSETFEVTVSAALPTAGSAGLYRAIINSIGWNSDDSSSVYNLYTSNLDAYRTTYISLN